MGWFKKIKKAATKVAKDTGLASSGSGKKKKRGLTEHLGGIASGAKKKVLDTNPVVSHASKVVTDIAKNPIQSLSNANPQAIGLPGMNDIFGGGLGGAMSSMGFNGDFYTQAIDSLGDRISNAYDTSIKGFGDTMRDLQGDNQKFAKEWAQKGDTMVNEWVAGRPEYQGYGDISVRQQLLGAPSTIGKNAFDQRLGRIGDVGVGGETSPYGKSLNDYESLRTIANTEGTTSVGQAQLDFQEAQQQQALDDLTRSSAGQVNNAMDQLALTGGASGGARERLMGQADQNLMNSSQNLYRQGMQDRLGIQAQDEARKLGLMQQNVGMGQNLDAYRLGADQRQQAVDLQKAGMYADVAGRDAATINQNKLNQANLNYQTDLANANIGMSDINNQNLYDQRGWEIEGNVKGSKYNADAMLASQGQQTPGGGMIPGMPGIPGIGIPGLSGGGGGLPGSILDPLGMTKGLFG